MSGPCLSKCHDPLIILDKCKSSKSDFHKVQPYASNSILIMLQLHDEKWQMYQTAFIITKKNSNIELTKGNSRNQILKKIYAYAALVAQFPT